MKQRKLGSQGLVVSAIGLGCSGMSGDYGVPDDVESIKTIHRAIELGVTMFDTSDAYSAGKNELLVGEGLKGKRDKVIIASKFGNVRGDNLHSMEACARLDVLADGRIEGRGCTRRHPLIEQLRAPVPAR